MSAACFFREQAIEPGDAINLYHPVYKSQGGTAVEPARARCHVAHHSDRGDFKRWGAPRKRDDGMNERLSGQ